jgi:hypothetical protein
MMRAPPGPDASRPDRQYGAATGPGASLFIQTFEEVGVKLGFI